jgi:hypothetical protein
MPAPVAALGQRADEVVGAGEPADQPALHVEMALPLAPQRLALDLLHPHGEAVGQHGRGGAGLRRDVVRPAMMPDHQAPEPVLDHDRDRHRAVDAEVALVFEVDRRQGAVLREGEVDRRVARGAVGDQRHRHAVPVDHEAALGLGVEGAGLRRDVGGGKAQADQRALPVRHHVLGDGLAVPIRVEAVDEHRFEAGHGADFEGGDLRRLGQGLGGAQPHHGELGVERARGEEVLGPLRRQFQLDDDPAEMGVRHEV